MFRVDDSCDLNYERESEKLWEEENKPREINSFVIRSYLDDAWRTMDLAFGSLARAKRAAEGFKTAQEIRVIRDELESLMTEVENLQDKLAKGGAE